jgi:hypothetical protein
MFDNLEKIAVAMGFPGITLEFLVKVSACVGSFPRIAELKDLPIDVGIAAKREYIA